MGDLIIRPFDEKQGRWAKALLRERGGSEQVAVHGTLYDPAEMDGFVAFLERKPAGLITYRIEGPACEVVTLDSLREGSGIGTALLHEVRRAAERAGCDRLWLVTTNDNLKALGFYQKRGFALAALRPGAVEKARRLKPEIPAAGESGIAIRDEIELDIRLGNMKSREIPPAAGGSEGETGGKGAKGCGLGAEMLPQR